MHLLCEKRRSGMPGTVCLLSLALLAGCSDGLDVAPVKGRVTLDGQPLDHAGIVFLPVAGGRPATARTNSEGTYELRFDADRYGATIGRHEVRITTGNPPVQEFDGNGKVVSSPARPERLPKRYHQESELTAEVKAGQNTFDFELTSK